MNNSPVQNLSTAFVLVVLCAVAWSGLGPIQLGGPVSYVIISGNSMEPEIELGDLVVARKKPSYEVNQQVVYNHPQIGFVFHRIIDQSREGFILKGDNNDWVDSYQPTPDEVLGKYWFSIPGAGFLIRTLREPIYFVSFVVIIAAIIAVLFFFPRRETTRRKKGEKRMSKSHKPGLAGDTRQDVLLSLGLLALAAITLGVFAFSRPQTITIADDIFYQHLGSFNYSADDESGIYDRTGVETGDPIYPLLTCKLNMLYTYTFSSAQFTPAEREALDGSIRVSARLSDADGWNRTFLLIPEYPFSGPAVEAPSTLNICRMLDIVADKEIKTGTEIRAYSLMILPEITISGSADEAPFEDTFSPEIEFSLGQAVLRLPDGGDNLALEQESMIPRSREVDNQLSIFGRQVKVSTLRWVAGISFCLSLIGAILPGRSIYLEWKESSEARIRVQNQPLLVDIKPGSLKTKGLTMIEVASFPDLRKIAESYGAMIMHEVSGGKNKYAVQDGSLLYLYIMEEDLDSDDEKK